MAAGARPRNRLRALAIAVVWGAAVACAPLPAPTTPIGAGQPPAPAAGAASAPAPATGAASVPAPAAAGGAAPATWEQVVAAAKQEGHVACGCPPVPEMRTFLTTEFQRAYPGISLDYTGAALPQFAARVEAERASGQSLWDVYFWGPGGEMFTLVGRGFFDPIQPALLLPQVADPAVWGGWDRVFLDRQKQYVFSFRGEVGTIGYNAKAVAPEDLRQPADLLDPKFKGKIAWWDPRISSGGSVFGAFFVNQLGEDALRRLLVDQEPVLLPNTTDVAERIVRGPQVVALPTVGEDILKPYLDAGLPIDVRQAGQEPQSSYVNVGWSTTMLFSNPPHSNAAKVFLNWLLSRETQTQIAERLGHNSRRVDVPAADESKRPLPGVDYFLPQSEYPGAELRARVIEIAKAARPQ
ncbi:MAG TPA: extracellular solute-binding protein [Chloroflexota bacterium]|jgi:iron(III) transport system substrate-binding protein